MIRFSPAYLFPILVGIPAGLGLFTFRYAEGLAYVSNNPKNCVNCHIMNDEYDSWAKSGHHHVAKCNDCHLPQEHARKMVAKAINGWNHSKAFTLQNFHEPVRIGPRNAAWLQENCIRCHADMVHDIKATEGSATHAAEAVSCVHCHKGVGHAPTRPTSKMSWIADARADADERHEATIERASF